MPALTHRRYTGSMKGHSPMRKAGSFDAQKYRDNPKMIAKYLNVALASDDAAVIVMAIGDMLRAHGIAEFQRRLDCVAKVSTDLLKDIWPRVSIRF
jgi:hypothetical protein